MVLPGARLSEDELHVPLGGGGTSPKMAPPTLLRRPPPSPAAPPSSSKDSTPSSTSHAPGCVTAMVRPPFLRSVYPRMRSTSGHEADLSTESESWSNCQPSLRTCKLRIVSEAPAHTRTCAEKGLGGWVGVGGVEGVHIERRPIASAGAGGIAGGSAGASRAADLECAVELELLDDNVRAVDEQRRALRDDNLGGRGQLGPQLGEARAEGGREDDGGTQRHRHAVEGPLARRGHGSAEQAQRGGVRGVDCHLRGGGGVWRHALRGEARGGGEAVLAREVAEVQRVADVPQLGEGQG